MHEIFESDVKASLPSFVCETKNPFSTNLGKLGNVYIFLKNISPAYFKNKDITRIQVRNAHQFKTIKDNNGVCIPVGYDSDKESYIVWDPILFLERINNSKNISIYSRLTQQNLVRNKDYLSLTLSNGELVYCVNKSFIGTFLKNIDKFFKEKTSPNIGNEEQHINHTMYTQINYQKEKLDKDYCRDKESFLRGLPSFEIILEIFIQAHKTDFKVLETNDEKLNNLIRLVVMDNHISAAEKRFLSEKTKELNLPEDLIPQVESYLNSNNPFLDKIFEMIYCDGIISKNELDFIQEKTYELGLDKKDVNLRFWEYGIRFHLNELLTIDSFKNWIVTWFISYKNKNITTDKVLSIFDSTDFNLIITVKLKECEHKVLSNLEFDIQIQDIYNHIYLFKTGDNMNLSNASSLHKDALCWFSNKQNSEIKQQDIKGLKNFKNGKTYLLTGAKGIYKPKDMDFALSIKVLMHSPYDDEIKIYEDGAWHIKHHKEDDNEWTNQGLINCMQNNIPVGLFYQIKERSPSIYKIYGLGLIEYFDGDYFYIKSISEDMSNVFDWEPEITKDKKSHSNNKISKEEEKIIELNRSEPFLAYQKFNKYYKTVNKNASKAQRMLAFNSLLGQNQ
ncbi:hypothetical protein N8089_04860 [Flavobacteriales bacterium]|nr:hypothetical protein [Flavobacteriales bacterium]